MGLKILIAFELGGYSLNPNRTGRFPNPTSGAVSREVRLHSLLVLRKEGLSYNPHTLDLDSTTAKKGPSRACWWRCHVGFLLLLDCWNSGNRMKLHGRWRHIRMRPILSPAKV